MGYVSKQIGLHGLVVELFVSTHWHDVEVRVHQELPRGEDCTEQFTPEPLPKAGADAVGIRFYAQR